MSLSKKIPTSRKRTSGYLNVVFIILFLKSQLSVDISVGSISFLKLGVKPADTISDLVTPDEDGHGMMHQAKVGNV